MNELQSLSQIFQNKLFRIPDYHEVTEGRHLAFIANASLGSIAKPLFFVIG